MSKAAQSHGLTYDLIEQRFGDQRAIEAYLLLTLTSIFWCRTTKVGGWPDMHRHIDEDMKWGADEAHGRDTEQMEETDMILMQTCFLFAYVPELVLPNLICWRRWPLPEP